MTSICHHLDDLTLMRFAAGDLDEAFAVVVSSHISMCDGCRRNLERAEAIGGALLDTIETPAQTASAATIDGFDELMASIDAEPRSAEIIPMPRREPDAHNDTATTVPAALRAYIGADLKAIKWKNVAPGLKKFDLPVSKDCPSTLVMLHIAPGMAVPEHGHGGDEITLILQGAYRDEIGEFGPGDVADLDDHIEHQPRVISQDPCICLAATEKPTRFKQWLPRLMQPLIGI